MIASALPFALWITSGYRRTIRFMRAGVRVIYRPNPLLFGVMLVKHVRKDHRLVCQILEEVVPTYEVFTAGELDLAPAAMIAEASAPAHA